MKIELFTLCDGAFNYNGKLTIVGALDGIRVHQVPSKETLNIAMKLLAQKNESVNSILTINIFNPDGTKIPSQISCKINIEPKDEISHISLAAVIQGVPFNQEGIYTIKVLLDQNQLDEYTFFVKRKSA